MTKNFEDKFGISKKLKTKAELSDEQVETVMKWLADNEEKNLDFVLKVQEKIEMQIEGGIFNEKEDFDVQAWSWNRLQNLMDRMGE